MKFDAWPVEPPGLGSGPLSSSTRSVQPSRARWYARLLPTMPAPIRTARAVGGSPRAAPDWSSTGVTSVGMGIPDISQRSDLAIEHSSVAGVHPGAVWCSIARLTLKRRRGDRLVAELDPPA